MAASKPMDERTLEVFEKLCRLGDKQVEQQNKIIEQLQKLGKQNEYIGETISIAEMRQCQANAQGTDASRMTASYFKAESALWSSSARASTLEMIYKSGDLSSIGYQGIFSNKDERRSEFATALFYKTYVLGETHLYNIFADNGEPPESLFHLMPSFRREMLQLAKDKDSELSTRAGEHQGQLGPHFERIQGALREIPADLQHLHEMVLPINTKFEPVAKISREDAPSTPNVYEMIPDKVKTFVKMIQGVDMCSKTEDKKLEITECIVKWCWTIKTLASKAAKVSTAQYEAKRAKYDHAAETTKTAWEQDLLERHAKMMFPNLREVYDDYDQSVEESRLANKSEQMEVDKPEV